MIGDNGAALLFGGNRINNLAFLTDAKEAEGYNERRRRQE